MNLSYKLLKRLHESQHHSIGRMQHWSASSSFVTFKCLLCFKRYKQHNISVLLNHSAWITRNAGSQLLFGQSPAPDRAAAFHGSLIHTHARLTAIFPGSMQWRKRSGGKVHCMNGNLCRVCGWMLFLSWTSGKDIHWTSSFLQPLTDSWRKGHRSLLCQFSDVRPMAGRPAPSLTSDRIIYHCYCQTSLLCETIFWLCNHHHKLLTHHCKLQPLQWQWWSLT